jgi:hypothetical protein
MVPSSIESLVLSVMDRWLSGGNTIDTPRYRGILVLGA